MYQRSPQTIKICDMFRNCNGHLSYETIENEMSKKLDELRPALHSARKYLERDEGIVFECIRGSGYERLDDSKKVHSTKKFTRRIRRNAINGITRANTVVNRANLSNDDQLRLTNIQETALLAAQAAVTKK